MAEASAGQPCLEPLAGDSGQDDDAHVGEIAGGGIKPSSLRTNRL
jgi:hypothetical protein